MRSAPCMCGGVYVMVNARWCVCSAPGSPTCHDSEGTCAPAGDGEPRCLLRTSACAQNAPWPCAGASPAPRRLSSRAPCRARSDAALAFEGTHNFSRFCNKCEEGKFRDPVKSIRRCRLARIDGGIRCVWVGGSALASALVAALASALWPALAAALEPPRRPVPAAPLGGAREGGPPSRAPTRRVEVHGSSFLYKQVRHMVGALLAVGGGRLARSDLEEELAAGGELAPQARRRWM